MKRDPVAAIIAFNRQFRGRNPVFLRRKLDRMCEGPFGFFRGTYHLFCQDLASGMFDPWRENDPFADIQVQVVGDIHTENYGTYRDRDKVIRYDINDFDEATDGSFESDCRRAAASLFLASYTALRPLSEATDICVTFLRSYIDAITAFARGKSAGRFGYHSGSPPRAEPVRRLLKNAEEAHRAKYIEHLTQKQKGARLFRRGPHFFDLKPDHLRQAKRLFEDYRERFAATIKEPVGFFEAVDFAGRVAGCGSLGRLRYVALLEGGGSHKAHNVVLEIKESLPSAFDLARRRPSTAAVRRGRAESVTRTVQQMQTVHNRFLGFAVDGDISFQVREMGPRDGRLEWVDIAKVKQLDHLADVYARLLAKAQAKADQLGRAKGEGVKRIAGALKGREDVFVKRCTAFALGYSEQVEEDHRQLLARRREAERALLS